MSDNKKQVKASGSKLRSGNRRFTTEEVSLIQERLRLQRAHARSSRPLPQPKNLDKVLANLSKTDDNNISSKSSSDSDPEYNKFSTPFGDKTLLPSNLNRDSSSNSIDLLHRTTLYQELRDSLISTTNTMSTEVNENPSAFPDSAFYKAIPEFAGDFDFNTSLLVVITFLQHLMLLIVTYFSWL